MMRKGSRLDRGIGPSGRTARIGRILIAAVLLAIAFAAVLQSTVAGVFRNTRPQIALAWAPYDAQARARLAVSLMENRDSEPARERAALLARDAVRRDPITPAALRALAASAERPERALTLVEAAQRLSRRDQGTQVWLIEHSIREGRADQALVHFDTALRTSWQSQQALFPLLASTLADRSLFDALMARLRRNPEWRVPFLAYLVDQDANPAQTARLARQFLDPRKPEEREAIATHLAQLAASREFDLAWGSYVHFGLAGADEQARGALINGGFEREAGVAPFAWWYAEEPDLFAIPRSGPDGRGGVLEVAAISGRTGEVARQLVRLAPGAYRLAAEFGDVPADEFERPELKVDCAGRDARRTLVSLRPAASGEARRSASTEFAIPAGCPFQWVSVSVAGDDSEGGPLPWVDSIELARIRGRS